MKRGLNKAKIVCPAVRVVIDYEDTQVLSFDVECLREIEKVCKNYCISLLVLGPGGVF